MRSFKTDIDLNRPPLIVSVASPLLTERSLLAGQQFEKSALLEFRQRFSAAIYEVQQSCRKRGIDTSQLETHVGSLVNTQMLRLVAVDLNGIAAELETDDATAALLIGPRSTPPRGACRRERSARPQPKS
jgi:hypothetical protein